MLLPIGYFVSIEAKSLFAHERLAGKKKEKKMRKNFKREVLEMVSHCTNHVNRWRDTVTPCICTLIKHAV